MEPVNSAYTVYDESGHALAGPFNVNGAVRRRAPRIHRATRAATTTRPPTRGSRSSSRIGPTEESSSLDIAVNSSGDPRTLWTAYKLDTTDPKRQRMPLLRRPAEARDRRFNLYVATDEFSILGPAFNGDQIYAFALKDLVAGKPAVHFAHFSKLKIGGEPANTIQPAITTGEAPAEYFMNSIDPTETEGDTDRRVGDDRRRRRSPKAARRRLSEHRAVLGALRDPAAGAAQKGSRSKIEAGDDRMQQTQFIGGRLWGALTTSVVPPGEKKLHDGAGWFEVEPSLHKDEIGPANADRRTGLRRRAGEDFIYPALQLTPSGNGAMVGTLTGSKRFPSAAYSLFSPAPGGVPSRWPPKGRPTTTRRPNAGATIPGRSSLPTRKPSGWRRSTSRRRASQTVDGNRDWGTRVFEVPTG